MTDLLQRIKVASYFHYIGYSTEIPVLCTHAKAPVNLWKAAVSSLQVRNKIIEGRDVAILQRDNRISQAKKDRLCMIKLSICPTSAALF